jgi:hypothetical protein
MTKYKILNSLFFLLLILNFIATQI